VGVENAGLENARLENVGIKYMVSIKGLDKRAKSVVSLNL